MNNYLHKFRAFWLLTIIAYTGLIGLFVFWNTTRPSGINWTIFSMQLLPLLLLGPSIVSRHYRAFSWLCFIILLYFTMAVMGALRSDANIYDYLFLSLTVTIFITSMLCSRYAQRLQKGL